jgi:type II secretory pathway pseudopilin PulG
MRGATGTSRPFAPTGFTLVHLLVILAILVFLIAMLVPMISRLRERSDLARCKDNLRQIGTVLLQYARTDKGKFPVSAAIDNPHLDILVSLTASHLTPDPAEFYCPAEHLPALCFSPRISSPESSGTTISVR